MHNLENNLEHFAEGKERKKLLKESTEKIKKFKENAKTEYLKGHYLWLDSPLDKKDEFKSRTFKESFQEILPEGEKSLRHYVEDVLKDKKGQAVGVEFGGIGVKLFDGFTKNFFKKSVGVSLIDHSDIFGVQGTYIKTKDGFINLYKKHKKSNHEILEGDIFSQDTYHSLDKMLNGDKVDFIIERMAAGLEFIPEEPYTVSKILQTWYKLLSKNGIMLVEVPKVFNELLKKWADVLNKKYKKNFDFDYIIGKNENLSSSVFRLHKLSNTPTELPFLDPRTVQKTEKNFPRGVLG